MSTTCMGVGGPWRMRAASVAPRTYSMTMCTPSSDSSTSYTAAMWGWFSRAAARASRSIFRRSSEASDPGGAGEGLEGHPAVQARVLGQPDLAVGARAEALEDPIRAHVGKGHGW